MEATTPNIELLNAIFRPERRLSIPDFIVSKLPFVFIWLTPFANPKNVPKIPKPVNVPGIIFKACKTGYPFLVSSSQET